MERFTWRLIITATRQYRMCLSSLERLVDAASCGADVPSSLKYRISKQGVASEGSEQGWAIELFTQVQNALPGIARPELFAEVTYPRFLSIGDDLLFSHRIGQ